MTALERMTALADRWERAQDGRAAFTRCYARMTEAMLAQLEDGEFGDPTWVRRWLERFADYFFEAAGAYEAGGPEVPEVWRFAFDAARRPETGVLARVMLGINAHINYDLMLALADVLEDGWEEVGEQVQQNRRSDFERVNDVIVRTVDVVQDEVVEREEPVLRLVDLVLGPLDEWLASRLILGWRDRVWAETMRRLSTPGHADREVHRREVEDRALAQARLFVP